VLAAEEHFSHYVEITRRATESGGGESNPAAWAVAGAVIAVVVFGGLWAAWAFFWKPRRRAAAPGDPDALDLVGEEGVAATDLSPLGTCRILGRTWPCRAENDANIPSGRGVLVVGWEESRYVVSPRPGSERP
jgi:membrane-bound ClpP family serine protease